MFLYYNELLRGTFMKRDFDIYLEEWKNRPDRKPLMIRGARQIGKTYAVESFAKKHFKSLITINFEEKPEYKDIFKTNDVKGIINNIELITGLKVKEGSDLLFIDEIQQCPMAIETLRYFYEKNPGLHIITAGSLLDHTLNDLKYSMPVGRIEFAYMQPLTFFEFLAALGENMIIDFIKTVGFETKISLPVHEKILKLVRLYYFIGGMPETLKNYIASNDITSVERTHESILKTLEYDFAKYGTRSQQEILITLLRFLPKGLGRKIKYVSIDPSLRSDSIKSALRLLELSRIFHPVKNTSASGLPLEFGIDKKNIKPLFLDIGLVNHILKLKLTALEDLVTVNEGGLAEQFVGQELLATEPFFTDPQLYYWTREGKSSSAELDYVIDYNNKIYPIEVKAGKTGTLKSLHIFMFEKKLKKALRFSTGLPSKTKVSAGLTIGDSTVEIKYELISLPIYLASEYKRFI